MSGRRTDHTSRPELMRGTVDFIVPDEYWASQPLPRLVPSFVPSPDSIPHHLGTPIPARPPTPLKYLFAIDVSENSVKSGLLNAACHAIRRILYGYEGGEGEADHSSAFPPSNEVAIITFDRAIHFYNLSVRFTRSFVAISRYIRAHHDSHSPAFLSQSFQRQVCMWWVTSTRSSFPYERGFS